MNKPASKPDLDSIVLDKPMFDPKAYRLDDEQAGLIAKARELAQANFAGRAAKTGHRKVACHLSEKSPTMSSAVPDYSGEVAQLNR